MAGGVFTVSQSHAEVAQQMKALSDLFAEKAKKLEQLVLVQAELTDIEGKISAVERGDITVIVAQKNEAKPARPKLAKPSEPRVDPVTGKRRRGRPSKAEAPNISKQPPLADVLVGLLQRHRHGLSLGELVKKAIETGYDTTSTNFSNMVQQAVGRLMRKNVLVRDQTTMKYSAA